MTPRQLHRAFEAAARRQSGEHNGRAWLAWHTAYLPNMKRRPALRDLMTRSDPAKSFSRRQKPEDRLALMRQLQGASAAVIR